MFESLKTAVQLKALKDQGLTNADIVQLIRDGGREAVLRLAG